MEISAEQRLFRETNAEFVQEQASVPAVRELYRRGAAFDRGWWSTATELGWTSLLVPEEFGGGSASGEGVTDLVSVAGLLGAHVSPGPLNTVSTVIAGVVHAASGGDHVELLESLMAGDTIATWAAVGVSPAWSPLAPGVTATPAGDGWTLDGIASRVEFAVESDVFLVSAKTATGVIEVLVDAHAPGVSVTSTGSVDFVRTFGDVSFSAVHVPATSLVAAEAAAAEIIAHQTRIANLLQVAEAVGAIGRVFEFTVQWGFDRFSFGRPLVSYQALKHRYADDFLWLEASRAILGAATAAVQSGGEEAQKLVSAAKSYVGDRGVQIVQDCVQLHGGLGVTMDHDLNVYLRRVMLARQLYGTPREHREVIASLIGI